MKILVISHTETMKMMCHCWATAGMEVIELQLPTINMATEPALKLQMARRIYQETIRLRPELIVNVNSSGILPLDDEGRTWTTSATDIPWCCWWWDSPNSFIRTPYYSHARITGWIGALLRPNVTQFLWDEVLAREYSTWFDKPCYWLPTAVNPAIIAPMASARCDRPVRHVDVSFLGEFYNAGIGGDHADDETEMAVSIRLNEPCKSYFDMVAEHQERLPGLRGMLNGFRTARNEAFKTELLAWKERVDLLTGIERRCQPLLALARHFPSRLFGGRGWPADLEVDTVVISNPAHVVACYQNAVFNLDLGNKQSFTGTTLRCYEIMASGAVLMCRQHPDFDPNGRLKGQAYLSFSSIDDLVKQCQEYKDRPDELRTIRENARQFVLKKHTWINRLSTMIGLMSKSTLREHPAMTCAESIS